MHIVITGGKGQLGATLRSVLVDHHITSIDLPEFDITNREAMTTLFTDVRPDLVIHCAAYTDVDGSARNPDLAHHVNALGTQNVALACEQVGAAMVHLSTNEVFSGDNPLGYDEWLPLSPRNPYGESKAAAEYHVRTILHRYYIVRTAWLFAPGGHNFIHTILRLAKANGQVRVVADEVGNPTYVLDLAEAITRLIDTGQYGIYHLVNSGACSRWAFANEILRLAGYTTVKNIPILSTAYKRPSSPPPFGVLHNRNAATLGITLRPWQEALAAYMNCEPDR